MECKESTRSNQKINEFYVHDVPVRVELNSRHIQNWITRYNYIYFAKHTEVTHIVHYSPNSLYYGMMLLTARKRELHVSDIKISDMKKWDFHGIKSKQRSLTRHINNYISLFSFHLCIITFFIIYFLYR